MSQSELLKLVARQLDAAGIDYMLTGSVASSLQGEPRASHDIDIVVAVTTAADVVSAALKAAFPRARRWAGRLGVVESLGRIRAEARPLE